MSPLPLISGVEVTIDGDPLDSTLAANLLEVRADQRFMLPAAFLIRIADPRLEHIDSCPSASAPRSRSGSRPPAATALELVLSGQIAAVEPEFGAMGRCWPPAATTSPTRSTAPATPRPTRT